MENYLNCKKIDTAINRAKELLIKRVRNGGIYENFGQVEVGKIKDKFIDSCDYSREMNSNRNKVDRFNNWCMEYTNR